MSDKLYKEYDVVVEAVIRKKYRVWAGSEEGAAIEAKWEYSTNDSVPHELAKVNAVKAERVSQ